MVHQFPWFISSANVAVQDASGCEHSATACWPLLIPSEIHHPLRWRHGDHAVGVASTEKKKNTEPPSPERYGGRGLANAVTPLTRCAALRSPVCMGRKRSGNPVSSVSPTNARERRPGPDLAESRARPALSSLRVLSSPCLRVLRGSLFSCLDPVWPT